MIGGDSFLGEGKVNIVCVVFLGVVIRFMCLIIFRCDWVCFVLFFLYWK